MTPSAARGEADARPGLRTRRRTRCARYIETRDRRRADASGDCARASRGDHVLAVGRSRAAYDMALDGPMSEDKTSVHSIADLLGKAKQQSAYLIVISAKSAGRHRADVQARQGRGGDGPLAPRRSSRSKTTASRASTPRCCSAPDGHFQLVDLGSTNGTFLNGMQGRASRRCTTATRSRSARNTVLKFSHPGRSSRSSTRRASTSRPRATG